MTLQQSWNNGENDGRILAKELKAMTDNVLRSHNPATCPCITCCKIRREKEKRSRSVKETSGIGVGHTGEDAAIDA
jgi:hypothetical protein